jgi:cytidine deaminase
MTDTAVDDDTLLDRAREATEDAVVPYSGFRVGAALATEAGRTYAGANLEVSNYSNSLHAEEVALARALMAGERSFVAVAVASSEPSLITPCGMCRQTLAEFCAPDLRVVCDAADGAETFTLGGLLPAAFDGAALE